MNCRIRRAMSFKRQILVERVSLAPQTPPASSLRRRGRLLSQTPQTAKPATALFVGPTPGRCSWLSRKPPAPPPSFLAIQEPSSMASYRHHRAAPDLSSDDLPSFTISDPPPRWLGVTSPGEPDAPMRKLTVVIANHAWMPGELLSEATFKKLLLLFDKIVLDPASADFARGAASVPEEVLNRSGVPPEHRWRRPFDWLVDKGLVSISDYLFHEGMASDRKFVALNQFIVSCQYESSRRWLGEDDEYTSRLKQQWNWALLKGFEKVDFDFWELGNLANAFATRALCLKVKNIDNVDAQTVLTMDDYELMTNFLQRKTDDSERKSSVVQIVLREVPMPKASVSWEKILEFRSDPDSISKLLTLRDWVTEVSHSNLTSEEIRDKTEYLMDQYRLHIKLHKLKTTAGLLETIVKGSTDILEDIAKFKISKLMEGLFSARRREIELLEAELKAPGREIAYIVKAKEQLK